MAGGGLTPANLAGLVRRSGVHELHASCTVAAAEDAGARFGFGARRRSEAERLRALQLALAGMEEAAA